MKFLRHSPPNPRIQWRHNAWTLCKLKDYCKSPQEKQILSALIFLHAKVSYTRTAALVKTKRSNLLYWARSYAKHGLTQLIKPICSNNMVKNCVEHFLKDHPNQRIKLLSGSETLLYSEWVDVDEEHLTAWVMENNYYGTQATRRSRN